MGHKMACDVQKFEDNFIRFCLNVFKEFVRLAKK